MSARVPILTYHSIDERGTILSTPPHLLRAHVEALARGGWRTARLEEIAASLREGRDLPERTVALTFDDGYRNFAERAWPILRDAGFGATLFALGSETARVNDWDAGPGSLGGEPLLAPAELGRLAEEGVEVGCHGASHARLVGLDAARLEAEVTGACRTLGRILGREVRVFAYPYGAFDAAAWRAVGAVCAAACSTRMGFASAASDLFRLERIDAYYLRDPRRVERLAAPGVRAYVAARGALRRLRSPFG